MEVSGWWWEVVKKWKKRSRRLDNHSFSGLSALEAPNGKESGTAANSVNLSKSRAARCAQIQCTMIILLNLLL